MPLACGTVVDDISFKLDGIISSYSDLFSSRSFKRPMADTDALMRVFGITQELKQENGQYWGTHLGKCFQRLVSAVCRYFVPGCQPGVKVGRKEICDLVVSGDALDTKYRVGSGDDGIVYKWRGHAEELGHRGYRPVMAIYRTDNRHHAFPGWTVYEGEESNDYIRKLTGFDLQAWLESHSATAPNSPLQLALV
jgi:hypothetical protein